MEIANNSADSILNITPKILAVNAGNTVTLLVKVDEVRAQKKKKPGKSRAFFVLSGDTGDYIGRS